MDGFEIFLIVFFCVIGGVVIWGIFETLKEHRENKKYECAEDEAYESIEKKGFDMDDVECFINATDWDYQDFLRSKGIQKMYGKFNSHGEMPEIKKTVIRNTSTAVVPMPIIIGQ